MLPQTNVMGLEQTQTAGAALDGLHPLRGQDI